MTDLLLDTELDDRQREYAEGVRSVGRRPAGDHQRHPRLLQDRGGQLELERVDFDLAEIVEDACATAGAAGARARGWSWLAWIDAGRARPRASATPAGCGRCSINLLGNAVKFTDAGEVVVRVDVERPSAGGVALRFEVRDTGIGIAGRQAERIFEAVLPGRRLDHPRVRRHRPRAGDLRAAGGADGRARSVSRAWPARAASSGSRCRSPAAADAAAAEPGLPGAGGDTGARGGRQRHRPGSRGAPAVAGGACRAMWPPTVTRRSACSTRPARRGTRTAWCCSTTGCPE